MDEHTLERGHLHIQGMEQCTIGQEVIPTMLVQKQLLLPPITAGCRNCLFRVMDVQSSSSVERAALLGRAWSMSSHLMHLVLCSPSNRTAWLACGSYCVFLLLQDGDRFWRMPEIFIRGNTLKYIRIPEEVRHSNSHTASSSSHRSGGLHNSLQSRDMLHMAAGCSVCEVGQLLSCCAVICRWWTRSKKRDQRRVSTCSHVRPTTVQWAHSCQSIAFHRAAAAAGLALDYQLCCCQAGEYMGKLTSTR